jgi:hypothetical protein
VRINLRRLEEASRSARIGKKASIPQIHVVHGHEEPR